MQVCNVIVAIKNVHLFSIARSSAQIFDFLFAYK